MEICWASGKRSRPACEKPLGRGARNWLAWASIPGLSHFGLIGEKGEILGNPVTYRDSRTDGVMDRTFRQVSKDRIFDATGIQFMPFNTLYQLMGGVEGGGGRGTGRGADVIADAGFVQLSAQRPAPQRNIQQFHHADV